MKIFIGVVIFTCLVFPVFSQNSDTQRFKDLSDSMDKSVSRSTDTLADFDSRSADDGTLRMFSSYRIKHNELVASLRESQLKIEHLFRTQDRVSYIRTERDNYERLLKELEAMKSEYDDWLKTVQ